MEKKTSRVAIVTGASGMRGIGRSIALRFAKQGLAVALLDIHRDPSQVPKAESEAGWRGIESVQQQIVEMGGRAICVYADISKPDEVERACAETLQQLGSIDVLVNNARAGIGKDRAPLIDLDLSEWDRVMNVNARGTFLITRAVARHMVERGGPGHIINMSSLSGKRGMALHGAYSASKFALNGLTQVLAHELGPYRINVNSICPGWVDTGRFSLGETLAAEAAATSAEEQNRAALEQRAKLNALGRIANSEDVAGMAAFLISEDAAHITGQAINVDGGECFH
ncbi:SDR family NAD(P)-dependent oxidoreductase [Hydrogenophaga sp.]|uniref:SDR family NAD(P)-dependent oxidoreductase n=1 Tax=Hydrogenophaga sp. TaxID=1904254 RepID=UPI00272719F1|nr:SDR family NAD(P)-dependent oxidoreductase [Hydrogenophaga sp.]MDO9437233.1 SDR family NAD(P)-dependent oxidoreductase [Hydrogenophaga sp.]